MTRTSVKQLAETLTTFAESEGNGVVEVNLADALLQIAGAIERLAAAAERNNTNHEKAMERRADEIGAMLASVDIVRQ